MKRTLAMICLTFIVLIGSVNTSKAQCKDMNSERIKNLLGEALYDNFRSTDIEYSKDPYDIEFQVDLLKSFVYKLVFDMSAKSEGVVIKLYDLGKKKENSEPKLLFTSSDELMGENAIFDVTFVAPKTRMLIRYEVKDATYEGCVTFALGVFRKEKIPKKTSLDFNN
jgi:hypothetical protein